MEPTHCTLCRHQIETPSGLTRGVCDDCYANTGLGAPVPALRPPVPCRRCNHTQLIRAVLRDRSVVSGDDASERLAPMAVTFGLRKETSFFLGETTVSVSDGDGHGRLVAHICRGCGYTELYTAGFAALPIGPQWGTELLDCAAPGPDATPFR